MSDEEQYCGTEIAIIGMAGRFPGAASPEAFWRNLLNEVESLTEFSREELIAAGISPDLINHPDYVARGMCLGDISGFDPAFFGIAPGEAALLDPQQRLILEVSWEALEHAGYAPTKTDAVIGVFAGGGTSHYDKILYANKGILQRFGHFQVGLAINPTHLATRIAYKLNLKGPAVTVATACSTSLSAVHLACQSLLNEETDLVLAGGVSLKIPAKAGYLYQKEGILSPDGHCRAFDAQAAGTAGGNGASMVVLKRLEQAAEDRDLIYAVIKGTAANNDGDAKVGFTAPSVEGQAAVITEALAVAEVKPSEVGYVETHGTGTTMGDPIEIAALTRAFEMDGSNKTCAIGSVKTNVGHMDTASGTTGLIKTAYMLYHEHMPAMLHFTRPNPLLYLEQTPFFVNQSRPWPRTDEPRRAGVSSFGVGGTNVHVVLEEAPPPEPRELPPQPLPILLSANTPTALETQRQQLSPRLQDFPLADIAFTLAMGRHDHPYRTFAVGQTPDEVREALNAPAPPSIRASTNNGVVFLFSGQGGEYVGMGRELYTSVEFIRNQIDELTVLARPLLPRPLSHCLTATENVGFDSLAEKNAALFCISYALAKLWQHWGVEPTAMLGLSLGEYVAACFSQVLNAQDCLRLIIERAKLVESLSQGKLLSVNLPADRMPEGDWDTAIHSAPDLTVVSGPAKAVDHLKTILEKQGVRCREIAMDRAFHSRMTQPLKAGMATLCGPLRHGRATIPWLSNVTGNWISPQDFSDGTYWFRHLRHTVRFSQCMAHLPKLKARRLLEIGPGDTLRALARRQLPQDQTWQIVTSLPRGDQRRDAHAFLLQAAAELWAGGCDIRWDRIFENLPCGRVPLPTYPFERQSYWVSPDRGESQSPNPGGWYYRQVWLPAEPTPPPGQTNETWLILGDETTLALQQHAAKACTQLFFVTRADSLSIGEGEIHLNPTDSAQVSTMLEHVGPVDRILHTWCLPLQDHLDAWIDLGFLALSTILDRHNTLYPLQTTTLIALTRHAVDVTGSEPIHAASAILSTLLKVVPQEYPRYSCRLVDIPANAPLDSPQFWPLLHSETITNSACWAVALRGRNRWLPKFVPIAPPGKKQPLRQARRSGVYLITGGLGRIGLFLAQTLARHVQARLVLVTRRDFPAAHLRSGLKDHSQWARAIGVLEQIEAEGAKVMVARCDIADREALSRLAGQVADAFGPVQGIFHAAAETQMLAAEIAHTDRALLSAQLRAKYEGTRTLSEVFGNDLDFCLCFSSNAAVLGRAGFAAYAAANGVMDTLVEQWSHHWDSPYISATWDGWHLGAQVPEDPNLAASLIDEASGTRALMDLVAHAPAGRVIVSKEPLSPRVAQWLEGRQPEQSISAPPIPVPGEGSDTPFQNPLQQKLAAIWEEVLGVTGIGLHAHFFDLGGHSLMGTQVMSRIRNQYDVNLPIKVLYECPTIIQLSQRLEQEIKQANPSNTPNLEKSPLRNSEADLQELLNRAQEEQNPSAYLHDKALEGPQFPLSFTQERLWFLHRLDPDGVQYHIPLATRLKGNLDLCALTNALNGVIQHQEGLRTLIGEDNGEPFQVIVPFVPRSFPLLDLTHLPLEEANAQAQSFLAKEALRPFDLTVAPFFRCGLLRLSSTDHWFYLTQHHIMTDGWSLGVFLETLAKGYAGTPLGPPPPIQYPDYASWQRQWLQGETYQAFHDYWVNQLGDGDYRLQLPLDFSRPRQMTHVGSHESAMLKAEALDVLKRMAQEEQVSLFMLILSAFAVILGRYSGQLDIRIGTAIAGRIRSELEQLIGCFINTLVLKIDLRPTMALADLLSRVRQTTLDAYAHQDFPFEALVKALKPERDTSHPPLCQVMFTLQNAPSGSTPLAGLEMEPMQTDLETVRFDLSLNAIERSDGLALSLQYNRALFQAQTIRRMLDHLTHVLNSFASHRHTPLAALPLSEERPDHLQTALNEKGPDQVWTRAFERMAAQRPDAVAVETSKGSLTYKALNDYANSIARRLRESGAQTEDRVGVLVPRSTHLVAALLGILKGGLVYLPLDDQLPPERLDWMMVDSNVKHLLVTEETNIIPDHPGVTILRVTPPEDQEFNPPHPPDPDQGAYIIYTSGSTGRPKGVLVPHGPLYSHCIGVGALKGHSPAARILHFASFNFDVSIGQLLPGLMYGATLVLPWGDLWTPHQLIQEIEARVLTHLHLTPAYWQELVYAMEEAPEIKWHHLQRLDVGGDVLPVHALQAWRASAVGHVDVYNGYGPTETIITATISSCNETPPNQTQPLGSPLPGRGLMILDSTGRPCPKGIPGELAITGDQLARGYQGNPRFTAQRFIPDAHATVPGARCYLSGDLVRHTNHLWFQGRLDHQVKVRGFRIELGEIEHVLAQHPQVNRCTVIAQKKRDPMILAFVEHQTGSEELSEELYRHLRASLPNYMVPHSLEILKALPVNINGKIDRPQLARRKPKIATTATATAHHYTDPAQELIASYFAGVLHIPQPPPDGDFFKLGGHSLLAMRLISMIRKGFSVELPLKTLFQAPTPAALAQAVTTGSRTLDKRPMIAHADLRSAPLSLAQRRLWFLERLAPGSGLYHMPMPLRLDGPLSISALEQALTHLVARHAVLRTSIVTDDGEPQQRISRHHAVRLNLIDLPGADEVQLQQLVQKDNLIPFNLKEGPLMRYWLARTQPQCHLFYLNQHHLISDGWSVGVLSEQLFALYRAFAQGLPNPLPTPKYQYTDYAIWQQGSLQGELLDQQTNYWKAQFTPTPEPASLPFDGAPPKTLTQNGATHPFRLKDWAALTTLSQDHQCTLFMTLLALVKVLLYRVTNQTDIVVGTPVAGRQQAETEQMLGLFANTLALRTRLEGHGSRPTFSQLLERVRTTVLDGHAHQDLPFEQLVAALDLPRNPAHSPLFQTMFTLTQRHTKGTHEDLLKPRPFAVKVNQAKFELTIALVEHGHQLSGSIEYNTDLFHPKTIKGLSRRLEMLAKAFPANPNLPLDQVPMLDEWERQEILVDLNRLNDEAPYQPFIHRFDRALADHGDQPALFHEGRTFTHQQLAQQTNLLATGLQQRGIGKEDLVAVLLGRSPLWIASVLAVWKAGATYFPLDPDYPTSRLEYMLADAKASLVLSHPDLHPSLQKTNRWTVNWDSGCEGKPTPTANPSPAEAAYVIYTSGTTGKPKGVVVSHGALSNHMSAVIDLYELNADDRLLQTASTSFDISIEEIFPTLAVGGALVLIPQPRHLGIQELIQRIDRHGVTVLNTSTALWHAWVEAMESTGRALPQHLRLQIVGTEAANPELLSRWRTLTDNRIPWINAYGPTETTVTATAYRLSPQEPPPSPLPIGSAVAGAATYILDQHLNPMPAHCRGELFIGGAGVARGYLHRPALTAARFLPDPFSQRPGTRMYRTGDKVAWQSAAALSSLHFFGRQDHQMKVRGYRIEPGEIEAALRLCENVHEALVICCHQQLIAYVQAPANVLADLADQLQPYLPSHMIPDRFIPLETFPVGPTGKLDRKALPDPELNPRQTTISPRNHQERVIAEIFGQLLGRQDIGVEDNFFALGGNSLSAVKLVAKIQKELGPEIPLITIFKDSTVARLAKLCNEKHASGDTPVLLEASSKQEPLILIHPVCGSTLGYRCIATAWKRGPVWGIESVGLKDESPPQTDLEVIAQHHVEQIRFIQTKGPYRILGWSMGGVLGVKISKKLNAEGHPVALAMIDSYPPKKIHIDETDLIMFLLQDLHTIIPHTPIDPEILKALPKETRLQRVINHLAEQSTYFTKTMIQRIFMVFRANSMAMFQDEPECYEGRVLQINASRGTASAAWNGLLNNVEAHTYEGDHYTWNTPANLKLIMDRLHKYFA